MAQITLNSTGVASSGALVLQSNGTTTAVTVSTGQVATLVNDAVVNGLTVGRGAGNVATNTAVGASALAANTSGSTNTAIGSLALATNTSSSLNTAVGYNAMNSNNGGIENSALGVSALSLNTTGNYNTAVGRSSLQSNTTASNNTAVGYQAGYSNTTATGNTALGYQALYASNRTADTNAFNTAIGYIAGLALTTGSFNTFVGRASGGDITTGSKNVIIGGYTGNSGGLDIRTASNYIVLSDGDGNPRGYFTNAGAFHVPTMAVGGTANLHWSSGAGQFFVTSSSRRFKHDIVEYDKGLAELMQMQPKYFVYNDEPNQKQRAGFIAEDFHDLGMTEYVEYWKDDEGNDTPSEIGYSNMVAILVKSIQELKAEFDAYKATHP